MKKGDRLPIFHTAESLHIGTSRCGSQAYEPWFGQQHVLFSSLNGATSADEVMRR